MRPNSNNKVFLSFFAIPQVAVAIDTDIILRGAAPWPKSSSARRPVIKIHSRQAKARGVALKWFKDEVGSDVARALLLRGSLVAPELILPEVLNAGWEAVRLGLMVPAQLDAMAVELTPCFARLAGLAPLAASAARTALSIDHPVYDCFYLALAELKSAPPRSPPTHACWRRREARGGRNWSSCSVRAENPLISIWYGSVPTISPKRSAMLVPMAQSEWLRAHALLNASTPAGHAHPRPSRPATA